MNLTKILLGLSLLCLFTPGSLSALEDEKSDQTGRVNPIQKQGGQDRTTKYMEEERRLQFLCTVTQNHCLIPPQQSVENLKMVGDHQATKQKIIRKGLESGILPHPDPDGGLPLPRRPYSGPNYGYGPSTVVSVNDLLTGERPVNLLDIGSAFGCDALALLTKHDKLRMTTVELYPDLSDAMNKLATLVLTPEQGRRLTSYHGEFTRVAAQISDGTFDGVILSQTLSFWPDDKIELLLKSLYPKVKPGGRIFIKTGSDEVFHNSWISNVFKGYCFYPGYLRFWGIPYGWFNFTSPQQMTTLSQAAGFEIESIDYVGTTSVVYSQSWWPLKIDQTMTNLVTTLKRPEDR